MHCVSRGGCYLVNSHCDLQEEDQWRRESYQASWLSLVMETRPQYKLTLAEKDVARRESYEQQQVVHFLVERSPRQILRLGTQGRAVTEHQLPLRTRSAPARAESPWHPHPTGSPIGCLQERGPVILEKEDSGEVTKPIRENFRASSLMSSPRETSHRVQMRE
ncbi:telethonin [Centroberyx gerrardi]|uniref:telethonin n=1 Tax=Centroberyx gerrardi TaxID=166262 RepID=UPI003AAC2AF1